VIEGVPQGKGLDSGVGADRRVDTRVIGANDYGPAAGSEVVVVTAASPQAGHDRDDLVRTNADIVQQVARQIKQHCPTAIVVVVSNPLDVMCWSRRRSPASRASGSYGMAGVLDTARYRAFREALDVSVEDIQAMVWGGHGRHHGAARRVRHVSGIPSPSSSTGDARQDRRAHPQRGGRDRELSQDRLRLLRPFRRGHPDGRGDRRSTKARSPCAAWLQGEYGCPDVLRRAVQARAPWI